MINKAFHIITIVTLLSTFFACRTNIETEELNEEIEEFLEESLDRSAYPDWSDATHGNDLDPDYSIVFNQNEVLRFDITIDSDNWTTMQNDLASLLGSTGGPGGPGGPGGMSVTSTTSEDPVWVPCSIQFMGTEWYKVGIRYKGNSSLSSAYQSGNNKLSLKLDFDEFEDDFPALKNQRFYGFKQLNLNNNFDDASLMREKVVADLFRQFGLISAQTTFCIVYIDNGTGPQYYGVYTLVEEIDDTAIATQTDDDTGNLYKPDGDAASFANGTYDESELVKKSNEDLADYSDVLSLYNILHSTERTSSPETWQNDLEEVLEVEVFLKWLAANTVIQNWDTYGIMTHNYFLYNYNNKLNWIPWDNNEALQFGKQGGALSLALTEVGSNWPLINYMMGQERYEEMYENYLLSFIDDVFIPTELQNTYTNYYNLLKNDVYQEELGYSFLQNNADFDAAVELLKTHVQTRNDAVKTYLKQ